MLRSMSWKQLQGWMAYDQVEPIGARRADWQAAMICTEIWNSAIATHGGKKRFKISDFLLKFNEPVASSAPQQHQTSEDHKRIMNAYIRSSGKPGRKKHG